MSYDFDFKHRLSRASGHLITVIQMVEQGRDEVEIAQQLQAVISAVENAKTTMITNHIAHYLEAVAGLMTKQGRADMAQLAKLAKYL